MPKEAKLTSVNVRFLTTCDRSSSAWTRHCDTWVVQLQWPCSMNYQSGLFRLDYGASWWRLYWPKYQAFVFMTNWKNMQHSYGIIPHMFDYWANPVVHLLKLKRSMTIGIQWSAFDAMDSVLLQKNRKSSIFAMTQCSAVSAIVCICGQSYKHFTLVN